MRQATELDLKKENMLYDSENQPLKLKSRYNVNTWLAVNKNLDCLEVVSAVDIHKYRVKE